MRFEEVEKHPGLTERLEYDLEKAGHRAVVSISNCDGYTLCRIGNLELEPEQISTLVRALRLINYNNDKFFRALSALEEYAK